MRRCPTQAATFLTERTKLQVAHFKLSHSRAFLVRAYPLQTHEMLFDAHNRAFEVFGGVPRRGIYDNMKTAVDRVRRGKERDVNARFSAMVSHYLFEAEFCNPASGWEKGQVEKNVRDARHRLWQPVPAFATLPMLNDWLEQRCKALWGEITHGKLPGTLADVWAQEQPLLMPVPRPFDGFVEHTKRVSPTCLVHFERNRYSVPASYANRPVSLRPPGRGGRGAAPVRAHADHRPPPRHGRPDRLRLASLLGGAATQAGGIEERRALQ